MVLRRLYLYIVSAASLTVLAAGAALAGVTALLFAFNDPTAQENRTSLAGYTAMVLVAGPVWIIHFWFARRYARREPADRTSALRRLYLYAACLGGAAGAAIAISVAAAGLLRPLIDTCSIVGPQPQTLFRPHCLATAGWESTAQAAWIGLVLFAVWAFHFRVAARDRAAAGETGASATLRRWYMYAALLMGLLMLLAGLTQTLEVGWEKIVRSPLGDYRYLGDGAGLALGGFALWAVHARTIHRHHVAEDRHSTLRALQGFIALAVSIASALSGLSMILYYGLDRALGANPGGVDPNDVAGALAGPASGVVVYSVAWVLVTRRLTRDAGTQEADRQAAIRRLYTNLVVLAGLAAWAAGAAILLGTLAEQAEAPIIGVAASDWKDPASLSATLVVVGLALWLAYWRHAPWAADRQSLSRRLYVWAALLGSVLAVLGAGVGLLTVVLGQLFSATPRLADPANLGFAHFLAVIVVAAAVGVYHWRVLRADAAARPARPTPKPEPRETQPVPAQTPARSVTDATPEPEPGPHGRRYTLVVDGATEDDLHQALATLPPQATYRLSASEDPAAVNGH